MTAAADSTDQQPPASRQLNAFHGDHVQLTGLARHWPALDLAGGRSPHVLTRATLSSGIGLLLIGAAQGIGAVMLGLSITSPGGLAARTGFALVAELILAAAIVYDVHRRPGE